MPCFCMTENATALARSHADDEDGVGCIYDVLDTYDRELAGAQPIFHRSKWGPCPTFHGRDGERSILGQAEREINRTLRLDVLARSLCTGIARSAYDATNRENE